MLLQNAVANFLGSLAAAGLLWFLVTRYYEISRSKKNKNELLSVSYALIKREIDAASALCKDHASAKTDELSAAGPITQAWDTLHSMEAFKYFSPMLSEKLVKYYSLLFRLKEELETEQMLYAAGGVPVSGADPRAAVRQRLRGLQLRVCTDLRGMEPDLRSVLDEAIAKLGKREKEMFNAAYEKPPV